MAQLGRNKDDGKNESSSTNSPTIGGTGTGNSSNNATTTNTNNTPQLTIKSSIRTSLRDALAGAAAGAVAKTAVAPIERVKLLMQLRGSIAGGGISAEIGSRTTAVGASGNWSTLSVATAIYRKEGIVAFWRGNTPNVLRQGGAAALNFMLMDWYKIAITPVMNRSLHLPSNRPHVQRKKRRTLVSSFLSGGLAGGTTTTVLYPIEFLRTRLAMDTGTQSRLYPRGMRDVFCGIWKTDGLRGLYQGYGIALGGVVLYRALHLGGYDACKTELIYRRQYQDSYNDGSSSAVSPAASLTFLERFAIAQVVSIGAGTFCYPIDSVRRRLMMQAGQHPTERLYRNSVHAFRRIFMEEGLRGFYFGIGPNVMRSFGGAMLLVSYDAFKGTSC